MRDRAFRRHQRSRLRQRRSEYWGGAASFSARNLGQIAETPHPCSCEMGCGNRRKHEGPTLQERKQHASEEAA